MEDLAQIVTFAKVVKAGSFTAAARDLKVHVSVVSKHVAKLERTLGVRLLNRSTRKLSLTEAGAAYHKHCLRIVEEMKDSRRALAELQAVPRGLLRVTVPVPLAARLGPLMREFLVRYPEIQLDLDPSNRIVDLAEEGFDVAIRFARTLPPSVVARQLLSMRLQLCASPGYLQREGVPQNPADLSRHNCLIAPSATQEGVWHFVRGSERVVVPVQGSLQTDAVEALYDLVLAGAGITLLPRDMAGKDIREGRLTPLLTDWEIEPGVNLYAVYLPTRHLAPKVRVFVDFLVGRLGAPLRRVVPAAQPPQNATLP